MTPTQTRDDTDAAVADPAMASAGQMDGAPPGGPADRAPPEGRGAPWPGTLGGLGRHEVGERPACASSRGPGPAAFAPAPGGTPCVVVLMAVYNGGGELAAQLDSLARQSHGNWHLIVSDDGSTDGSQATVDRFAAEQERHGRQVIRIDGPRRGDPAPNFMYLLAQAQSQARAGYWIAFADQDDVWLPDRLERGIAALVKAPRRRRDAAPDGARDHGVPHLYCSRTWVTDAALAGRRLSPPRPRPAGLRNALVQNICAGNTILLDTAAARLATAAASEPEAVVMHDWWLYLIVTAAGGRVIHDDAPTLLYRQHAANRIGANDGTVARIRRIAMILSGTYRDWNDVNAAALSASSHRLTAEAAALIAGFAAMRAAPGPTARLRALRALGLYRQSRTSTIAMRIAASMRLL